MCEAPTTQQGPNKGQSLCTSVNGLELESRVVSCPTLGMSKLELHIHLMGTVLHRVNSAETGEAEAGEAPRLRQEKHPGYAV